MFYGKKFADRKNEILRLNFGFLCCLQVIQSDHMVDVNEANFS